MLRCGHAIEAERVSVVAAPAGVTRKLAEWALSVEFERLPEATLDHAKQAVLDCVGIAVRARFECVASEAVRRAVRGLAGPGTCTGIGYGPDFVPHLAAFVNACNFHMLDFDDTHERASLHPGAPVIGAALAAAEACGANGRALAAASVAGYDVAVRIGLALEPNAHYARGFHPTATAGVFGATAAVAHLHGDSADTLESAFGINLSQAAGSLQFSVDGAETKPVQVGFAAQNAVIARELAAAGIRGANAALEGRSGLLHAYSDGADPAGVFAGWDGTHEIDRTAFKPYPCCRYMHAAIDTLAELQREGAIDPESVERVRIGLPPAGRRLCAYPEEPKRRPATIVDAQFSMYYAAAATLARGSVRWDDYARRGEAALAALSDRVTVVEDPEVEALVPAMAASVEIDAGPLRVRRLARAPRGEPHDPLPWSELIAKFDELASIAYAPSRRRRIVELVRNLDALDDVRTLTAELGG
jgi:2-methylcitrate dehydratase PrpD